MCIFAISDDWYMVPLCLMPILTHHAGTESLIRIKRDTGTGQGGPTLLGL